MKKNLKNSMRYLLLASLLLLWTATCGYASIMGLTGTNFNLKAKNHQVIGTSQNYSSASACDAGMSSVAKAAADATVDDQT